MLQGQNQSAKFNCTDSTETTSNFLKVSITSVLVHLPSVYINCFVLEETASSFFFSFFFEPS